MIDVMAKYLDEIERLREALKFYADPKTYERKYLDFVPGFGERFEMAPIENDLHGRLARTALRPPINLGPAPASALSPAKSHDPQGVISDGSRGPDTEMQGRLPRETTSVVSPADGKTP